MDTVISLLGKLGIGGYVAIILAVIRLVESINQVINKSDAKGIIAQIVALIKAFFLEIETYKK